MRVVPWQMLPYFESGGARTLEYFLDIFHRDHDCFEVLNWSYIRLFSLAEMVRMVEGPCFCGYAWC